MSKFTQIHTLTSYGPSNLNRDDAGRPKSVTMGGVNRLRVSSQCLKRAWRTSDVFKGIVGDHLGIRTRRIGAEVEKHLADKGIDAEGAKKAATAITNLWKSKESAAGGKGKEVLFLFSCGEFKAALDASEKLARGEIEEIGIDDIINPEERDVDVSMFGRMLAAAPQHSVTAACQVSHAITTHRADAEDDYFAACDDLSDTAGEEGSGAGHVDAREFGSGVFYTYICIDRDLLIKNLGGRHKLADLAIEALIKSATTVSPGGMQASFASRSFASYALVETGNQQPRSLASAFTKPVRSADYLRGSVDALTAHRKMLAAVYGPSCSAEAVIDVTGDEPVGSLQALVEIARAA